jgi:hypothetical protein
MTLGTGPRGYRDDQREENYDGPILESFQGLKLNEGVEKTLGPYDVSRYAAVAINAGIFGGSGRVRIELVWKASTTSSVVLAERSFLLKGNIGAGGQLRISNLGPALTIRIFAGETVPSLSFTVLPTNRLPTQEAVPIMPVLASGSVALAKGAEFGIHPTDLASGTLRVGVQGDLDGFIQVKADVLTPENVLAQIAADQFTEAEIGGTLEAYVPPLPLAIGIVNLGPEQTINYGVTVQPG